MSQVYKSRRQSAYVIRVAHPYCVHLGDAGKKSFGCTAGMIGHEFSLSVFGRHTCALHCASGHPAKELIAVADSQDGYSRFQQGGIVMR